MAHVLLQSTQVRAAGSGLCSASLFPKGESKSNFDLSVTKEDKRSKAEQKSGCRWVSNSTEMDMNSL